MPAFSPETRPLRAVIYCRVSSDPTGQQLSVTSQEQYCRGFASERGIEIIRVFVDNDIGASPHSLKERPDFRRMTTWLQSAQVDMLIAWTSNRTTRNTREYLDLRDLCAERGILYSYSGSVYDMRNPSDRFKTGLDALLGEHGADEIHANVLRGKESAARAGRPAGKLLWGTIRKFDKHRAYLGTFTDPELENVLNWMWMARWRRHVPKYRIARVLTRARVLTPRPPLLNLPKEMPKDEKRRLREAAWPNHPWTPEAVDRVFKNPAYAGFQVHKGQIIGRSDWSGVVSPEVWQDVQDYDREANKHLNRDRTLKHLQTGIMRCGLCDGKMQRGLSRKVQTLTCRACGGVSLPMDVADQAVEDLLVLRFAKPDILALLRPADNEDRVSAATAKHRALVDRLKKIERAAIAGDAFDEEFLEQARAELKPQIAAAAEAMKPPRPLPEWASKLAVPDPRPVWKRMPIETKRDVVRTMLTLVGLPVGRIGKTKVPIQKRMRIDWRELP